MHFGQNNWLLANCVTKCANRLSTHSFEAVPCGNVEIVSQCTAHLF